MIEFDTELYSAGTVLGIDLQRMKCLELAIVIGTRLLVLVAAIELAIDIEQPRHFAAEGLQLLLIGVAPGQSFVERESQIDY